MTDISTDPNPMAQISFHVNRTPQAMDGISVRHVLIPNAESSYLYLAPSHTWKNYNRMSTDCTLVGSGPIESANGSPNMVQLSNFPLYTNHAKMSSNQPGTSLSKVASPMQRQLQDSKNPSRISGLSFLDTRTHIHTHTHIYIYMYIYIHKQFYTISRSHAHISQRANVPDFLARKRAVHPRIHSTYDKSFRERERVRGEWCGVRV